MANSSSRANTVNRAARPADSAQGSGFRYPLPTAEDLPALARLAFRLSATECSDCRNYHVMWPYLRSIGANGGGPEFSWPEQLDIVAAAAAGPSHVRWLLAGSADAGQLAMVAEAMKTRPEATYEVTIIDRCATPLAVCDAHARSAGIRLSCIKGDLQDHAVTGYDVVLIHHTMVFFSESERADFLTHAAGWLAPEGRIVMSLSVDRPGAPPPPRPNLAVAEWRKQRITAAIEDGELELPEDLETFLGRAGYMREGFGARAREHRLAAYLEAFEGAGLAVERQVILTPDITEALAAAWKQRDRLMMMLRRSTA